MLGAVKRDTEAGCYLASALSEQDQDFCVSTKLFTIRVAGLPSINDARAVHYNSRKIDIVGGSRESDSKVVLSSDIRQSIPVVDLKAASGCGKVKSATSIQQSFMCHLRFHP
jgi:hypothetical protein